MYGAWTRMGFPVSEEGKRIFKIVDRVGGLQKFMYEDNEVFETSLYLMAMQREPETVKVACKMTWDIFVTDWLENKNLLKTERGIVKSLYDIFFNSEGYFPAPAEALNFSSGMLQLHSEMDHDDEAYSTIIDYTQTIFGIITTAIDMMKIPLGEEFDDARTFHKVKVSGILMSVDMPELLQSLINEMYESNLSKNDFIQAALSLELLADTYDWNTAYYLERCEAPKFPAQSEFKRKEALFKLIASNFTKGGKIDQAIDTYNELLEAYQKYNFDLSGLSFCHGELCKSYAAMENTGRIDSSYFMVSYIGLGFPENRRGKDFIIEGMAFEHITSINHRLTRLYPVYLH
ncbi:unnamed protein product [Ambrosiozyma monospora]|uniref:Unnamed protein product n=1 Tax=Ambrosiozyma monospora TaxID=43982 RepID=A0ACB5TDD0_AMBMO|nr:unnamed protein product [Ambrosiozyma monospora]